MAGERVTTARIESLLALATPGPWCRAYHAGWEVEAAPNQRLADCGTIGAAASDALLMSAARDLGADLLDARARIDVLETRDRLRLMEIGILGDKRDTAFTQGVRRGLEAALDVVNTTTNAADNRLRATGGRRGADVCDELRAVGDVIAAVNPASVKP
jgi:hypothetical protein